MSNLNLSIDMDRVQSSVNAAIRPAVEKALAEFDAETAIREALEQPAPNDYYHPFRSSRGMLEQMVHDEVRAVAQSYVQDAVQCRVPEITEALHKMMAGSSDKLAKAFVGAAVEALESGTWSFDLNLDIRAEVQEYGD